MAKVWFCSRTYVYKYCAYVGTCVCMKMFHQYIINLVFSTNNLNKENTWDWRICSFDDHCYCVHQRLFWLCPCATSRTKNIFVEKLHVYPLCSLVYLMYVSVLMHPAYWTYHLSDSPPVCLNVCIWLYVCVCFACVRHTYDSLKLLHWKGPKLPNTEWPL